jgi:ABC-type uncharacterized transport system permease subunit
MAIDLHTWTAFVYLAAAILAAIGVTAHTRRLIDAAIVVLALGAVLHGFAMWMLHELDPVPQLTDLPFAVSLMSWLGTIVFLGLLALVRGRGLVIAVAPLSFLGAFFASLSFGSVDPTASPAPPLWSHLHILLASAGLAVLGLAGAAGLLYLIHHRQLKSKRRAAPHSFLPSLETLDRVNSISLVLGFLLLSLGLVTGVLWTKAQLGEFWTASWHANATALAWLTYASIVAVRFGRPRTARSAAAGATAAFGILVIAVIGIEAVL